MATFDPDHKAIAALAHSPQATPLVEHIGTEIRDRARHNASPISPRLIDAIVSDVGEDEESVYTRIGYDKDHEGFVLWFHEVGTEHHKATPHLRPALRSYRFKE